MKNDNEIQLQDLSFYYADKCIFDKVNITIPSQKITVILGPSGSGKTTLLRLISGFVPPTYGQVIVDNKIVHKLSLNELYAMRKNMGFLFQSGALFTDLSVFDNIAFPLREQTKLSEELIRVLVLMKLEAVGLRGAEALMPQALSGGMARRVALARAIALDPKYMLYDEPFTGQDPIAMGVLLRLIKRLNEHLKTTTIVVSHDVAEAASIADYIYLIFNGRVLAKGTPEFLYESKDLAVRQFMRGEADGPVRFHYPSKKQYLEDLIHAE